MNPHCQNALFCVGQRGPVLGANFARFVWLLAGEKIASGGARQPWWREELFRGGFAPPVRYRVRPGARGIGWHGILGAGLYLSTFGGGSMVWFKQLKTGTSVNAYSFYDCSTVVLICFTCPAITVVAPLCRYSNTHLHPNPLQNSLGVHMCAGLYCVLRTAY